MTRYIKMEEGMFHSSSCLLHFIINTVQGDKLLPNDSETVSARAHLVFFFYCAKAAHS